MDNKDFKCARVNNYTKEDLGFYHHPTYKATMYIEKDGKTIELNPEEIKQVVKTAGGNFKS